jgi:CxxC motif-containing protein (DUF1111 family)
MTGFWWRAALVFAFFLSASGADSGADTEARAVEMQLEAGKLYRTDLGEKDRSRVEQITALPKDFSKPQPFEAMSGGAATSTAPANRDAFSHPSANLSFEKQGTFKLGNALFKKLWVSSPSSTKASDGLGPLFNARSCQSCHIKDGRGHPPENNTDSTGMFLRLARKAVSAEDLDATQNGTIINLQDPVYGAQLQDSAVPGLAAEGRMVISHTRQTVAFPGGAQAELRKPIYNVADLAFGALHPDTTLSPRIAPPMIGLGLIEAIHEADIAALADPEDADKNQISGRMALVRDESGDIELGRFGWKAQNANVRRQSAEAFSGDIGISTADIASHYGDCTKHQPACFQMPHGEQARLGKTEAPGLVLELVTFYSRNLAVPARRNIDDATVLHGKQMFHTSGCASCHKPNFVTRRDAGDPAQSFQLIWPYSDFLLHDMGEGLADGQQAGLASGREWRTPPLWGIGLTKTVSGHTFFLHDGRARNLEEAILWHGGEAQAARTAYMALTQSDRDSLIRFLESL